MQACIGPKQVDGMMSTLRWHRRVADMVLSTDTQAPTSKRFPESALIDPRVAIRVRLDDRIAGRQD